MKFSAASSFLLLVVLTTTTKTTHAMGDFEAIRPVKEVVFDRPPTPPPPTPPPPTPVPPTKVVTLGDSYSSGTGIWPSDNDYDQQYGGNPGGYQLTARSDNECWRETDDTPGPRYANSLSNGQSIFLACKGAEAIHVENQLDYLHSLYPTDASNGWTNTVLLLTAGGNDIRTHDGDDWPELLKHCILEINPFKGCHQNSDNHIANWNDIFNKALDLYEKLALEAPNAKVRIMGYPRVMQRDPGCSSVTGISRNEADWMDDQIDVLNGELEDAVQMVQNWYPNFDIEFVSMLQYITIGACGGTAGTREVNDKVLSGLSTSDSSFHPSDHGYDQYYAAFIASL